MDRGFGLDWILSTQSISYSDVQHSFLTSSESSLRHFHKFCDTFRTKTRSEQHEIATLLLTASVVTG